MDDNALPIRRIQHILMSASSNLDPSFFFLLFFYSLYENCINPSGKSEKAPPEVIKNCVDSGAAWQTGGDGRLMELIPTVRSKYVIGI